MKPRADLAIRPEALEEIQAAREWYGDQDRDSADEFLRELARSLSMLREVPRAGRSIRRMRTRVYPMRGFPYVIVYRLRRPAHGIDSVEIVAVAHGSRRPGYWRDRSR